MPATNRAEHTLRETVRDARSFAITVVFTTWTATAAALRTAVAFANGGRTSITIVAAEVVPWPADLQQAHIPVAFCEDRLRELAALCHTDTFVNVYVCRDRLETLRSYIPPERIVIIGARKHRWPNPDLRLAAALGRAGFEVIVAPEK